MEIETDYKVQLHMALIEDDPEYKDRIAVGTFHGENFIALQLLDQEMWDIIREAWPLALRDPVALVYRTAEWIGVAAITALLFARVRDATLTPAEPWQAEPEGSTLLFLGTASRIERTHPILARDCSTHLTALLNGAEPLVNVAFRKAG